MLRMLIIADDLSGAADCAIACTGTGMSAVVSLNDETSDISSEVLAVDSDSRHLEPHVAADRVAALMHCHAEQSNLLVYKKVDSTLRGNVGAEVASILQARREHSSTKRRIVALLAPAFPAGGRTTVNGCQLVHGEPLHMSETWQHQQLACLTDIPSMIQAESLRSALVELDRVRAGNDSLRRTLSDLALDSDVLVCDAETDEDLKAIAVASSVLGSETIWVGSAGLAYHLPRATGLSNTSSRPAPADFAAGPALIVIGSMSTVSRRQVAALAEASDIEVFSIPPHALLSQQESTAWVEYAEKISRVLRSGRDLAIILEPEDKLDSSKGRLLSSALATILSPFRDTVGSLVASGGETARAILDRWGITSLRMLGELEPGLPFAITEGHKRALPVVTKAGAFGNSQTLVRCLQHLKSLERSTAQQDI
jgi:D-threonate/D-erythronate kinase